MSEQVKISKTCTKCNIEKPLVEFNKQTASPDGYKNYCKDCFREINKVLYGRNKKKIIKRILSKRKELKKEIKREQKQLKLEQKKQVELESQKILENI